MPKIELTKDDISILKHYYQSLMGDYLSLRDYAIARGGTLAQVYLQAKENLAELDELAAKLK